MRLGVALVLILALPSVVSGQTEERERFELYTQCRPVLAVTNVVVHGTFNWEPMRDAIKAAAEDSVESRLRAAGLWWPSPEARSSEPALLRAELEVDHDHVPSGLTLYPYEVRLELHKPLMDEFGNRSGGTNNTWTTGIQVLSWHDPPRSELAVMDALLSALRRLLDQFAAAYLRVNASAC